jgi:hypothetical protein
MAGLVPAIHAVLAAVPEDVDARTGPGMTNKRHPRGQFRIRPSVTGNTGLVAGNATQS